MKPSQKTRKIRSLALALVILLTAQLLTFVMPGALAATGTPLSPLRSAELESYTAFNEDEPNTNVVNYLLQTTANEKVRVMFYKDDLFRIWVANRGTGDFIESSASEDLGQTYDIAGAVMEELELVTKNDFGAAPAVTQSDEGAYYSFKTAALELRAYKDPFLFELRDALTGAVIWSEAEPIHRGASTTTGPFTQVLDTDDSEYFYGGGMQVGYFSHKGRKINLVASGWTVGGAPNPVPFYMSTKGYGVFRRTFKTGTYDFSLPTTVETLHNEPRFDAYYFYGPSFEHILDGFTDLTGRPHLLPKWGIGLGDAGAYRQQYDTEAIGGNPKNGTTYNNTNTPNQEPYGGFWRGYDGTTGAGPDVIEQYIEEDVPLGWVLPEDGYGCEYNKFTHPGGGLNVLADMVRPYNIRLGLWVGQPSNYIDRQYTYGYPSGSSTAVQAECFQREIQAQSEWGVRMYKIDVAWSGNRGGGRKGTLAVLNQMYHNVAKSGERGFVITVLGWAGAQKYAVPWSGDQAGSNDYAQYHIPSFTGSSMSGLPYTTSDTGSIYSDNPGLYVRDLQSKALTTMSYAMNNWGNGTTYANANPNGLQNEFGAGISTATTGAGARATSDKRPASSAHFTDTEIAINKKYAMLQRTLVPYLYSYVRKAHERGTPIVRPMVYNYQNDPNTYDNKTQYQYMSGDWLLAAPVIDPPLSTVRDNVYLPAGRWIDYWTGEEFFGPKTISVPAPYDTMPIFVRAGAIIPMQEESVYDNQTEYNGKTLDGRLILDLYPEGKTSFSLYEDDGYTFDYEKGEYTFTEITSDAPLAGNTGALTVTVGAAVGNAYEGQLAARKNELRIHTSTKPGSVKCGDTTLSSFNTMAALEASANGGWYYDANDKSGVLYVLTPALAINSDAVVVVDRFTTSGSPEMANSLSLPENVTATALSVSSIQVAWSAVPGAAAYEIEVDGGAVLQTLTPAYTHINLTPESMHSYRVRALNATEYSGWTLPVRCVTPALNAKVPHDTTGWSATFWQTNASDQVLNSNLGTYANLYARYALDYSLALKQQDGTFHSSSGGAGNYVSIVIDMKELKMVSEVEYMPRGDNGNGTVSNYTLYTSLDGTNWTTARSGTLSGGNYVGRWITLTQPVMCRYIRLRNNTTNNYVSGNYIKIYAPQGNVVYNSAAVGATADAGGNIWQTDGTDLEVLSGVTASTEPGESESSGGFMPDSLTDGVLSKDRGWRTEYISRPPHFPYTLNLSLAASTRVYGLTYYPLGADRFDAESAHEGDITKFAVYSGSTFLIGGEWPADGQPHTVYFRSTQTNNLRFVVLDAEGRYGAASQFQVLGAKSPNTTSAPIVTEMNYAPEFAVDNRSDTAWSSRQGEAATLEIDLGSVKTIDYGRIVFGTEIPSSYTVQYRNAQGNWTNFVSVTGNSNATPWLFSTPVQAVQAQYWRLTVPTSTSGVTVRSFELYAQELPASLTISDSQLNMKIGDTALLTSEILPVTARDHTVTWSSSDSSIAYVNEQTGKVTAYGGGQAVITATSKANSALTATCVVDVETVPVASVTLDKTGTLYLGVGETCQLYPTILPTNAVFDSVDWSSSDETAVSISGNGFVKGLTTGSSVVTVSCGGQTATVNVQVVDLSAFASINNETGVLTANFDPALPTGMLRMLFTATYDDGYGAKTLNLFNMVRSGNAVQFDYTPFPPNKRGEVLVTLQYQDGREITQTLTVEQGYTITFLSPGADADADPSKITLSGGATTVGTLPAEPFRAHATFVGWFTKPEGEGTQFLADTPVTDDITVYAAWDYELFTVAFETNGADPIESIQVPYTKKIPEPATLVREGYLFRGWYKDAALKTMWNFNTDTVAGDVTLYASWVTPATGQVFYYPFDDASELSRTGAYGINAISANNRPVVTPDAGINGSLRFPGNNGYIRVDANSFPYRANNTTQPFTIAMWINPTAVNRDQFLFTCDTGDDWLLLRNGGYLGTYGMGGGNTTMSHAPIKAGEWTHIAVTVDATTVTLYVNGQLAGSHESTSTWWGSVAGFYGIGGKSNSTTSTGCFTGYMDELYFFDTTLSAGQIQLMAINKSKLAQAIRDFEALTDTDWSIGSWAAADAAYQNALAVFAEEYPMQGDVDAATAGLVDAMDALDFALIDSLNALFADYEGRTVSHFTAETWQVAEAAYDAAKAVANSAHTYEELLAVYEALQDALEALKVPDTTLELNQPSQIRLRVGQTHTIMLNSVFEPSELTYSYNPPGFLTVSDVGVIKCTKAGGIVILIIKATDYPQAQPLTVVVTTSA